MEKGWSRKSDTPMHTIYRFIFVDHFDFVAIVFPIEQHQSATSMTAKRKISLNLLFIIHSLSLSQYLSTSVFSIECRKRKENTKEKNYLPFLCVVAKLIRVCTLSSSKKNSHIVCWVQKDTQTQIHTYDNENERTRESEGRVEESKIARKKQ